jgi:hypothetical protein
VAQRRLGRSRGARQQAGAPVIGVLISLTLGPYAERPPAALPRGQAVIPAAENLRNSGYMHRSKTVDYSITLSAMDSRPPGTVRPSARAVARLTTSSNLHEEQIYTPTRPARATTRKGSKFSGLPR